MVMVQTSDHDRSMNKAEIVIMIHLVKCSALICYLKVVYWDVMNSGRSLWKLQVLSFSSFGMDGNLKLLKHGSWHEVSLTNLVT